jgi:hypothetical protein
MGGRSGMATMSYIIIVTAVYSIDMESPVGRSALMGGSRLISVLIGG